MKKAFKIINTAAFFAIIAALSLSSLIISKPEFSELENRYLSDKPELTVKDWFSGDYAADLSSYIDDSFALRPNWISLHTSIELLTGKKAVNGVYISDKRMSELVPDRDFSCADDSAEAIKGLSLTVDVPVYVMLAPTAAGIYADEIKTSERQLNQKKFIEYVYDFLETNKPENLETIDAYDVLYNSREDYIYYRTDHHWTQRGAYIAYAELAGNMGLTPSGSERFNIMHASHGFLGTLHSKTLYNGIEADTVDFYISNSRTTSKTVFGEDAEGELYEPERLENKDKYLCYLGENRPFIKVSSTAGGGRALVIKDSYANCFVPFLAEHFSEIDVIDLRYITDPNDYISINDYDCVIVLYNAANFSEDNNLKKLALLSE